MRYTKDFKKTVWGFFEVVADSKEEADRRFDEAEYDEIDNKSEYEETGEWEKG